jgi:hypothetical protein
MKESIFNPGKHQDDIKSKIIVGLERISESFRVLLRRQAKLSGAKPPPDTSAYFLRISREKSLQSIAPRRRIQRHQGNCKRCSEIIARKKSSSTRNSIKMTAGFTQFPLRMTARQR